MRKRALLLGGNDDQLPEGWGKDSKDDEDVDMEITFTPGLAESKAGDETTLEKYQRKMKEKRKKRKEEVKEKEKVEDELLSKVPEVPSTSEGTAGKGTEKSETDKTILETVTATVAGLGAAAVATAVATKDKVTEQATTATTQATDAATDAAKQLPEPVKSALPVSECIMLYCFMVAVELKRRADRAS